MKDEKDVLSVDIETQGGIFISGCRSGRTALIKYLMIAPNIDGIENIIKQYREAEDAEAVQNRIDNMILHPRHFGIEPLFMREKFDFEDERQKKYKAKDKGGVKSSSKHNSAAAQRFAAKQRKKRKKRKK